MTKENRILYYRFEDEFEIFDTVIPKMDKTGSLRFFKKYINSIFKNSKDYGAPEYNGLFKQQILYYLYKEDVVSKDILELDNKGVCDPEPYKLLLMALTMYTQDLWVYISDLKLCNNLIDYMLEKMSTDWYSAYSSFINGEYLEAYQSLMSSNKGLKQLLGCSLYINFSTKSRLSTVTKEELYNKDAISQYMSIKNKIY